MEVLTSVTGGSLNTSIRHVFLCQLQLNHSRESVADYIPESLRLPLGRGFRTCCDYSCFFLKLHTGSPITLSMLKEKR